MTSFQDYILQALCSPAGRLSSSDTPWMQYLLETYTDKKSYGDYLDAIEESSRELSVTPPRPKTLTTVRPTETYSILRGTTDGIYPLVGTLMA